MNEHEGRFADSGLPITRPLTRRAALKVGALGVLGAAAAAYLPGRARAGTIAPAPCHAGQGFVCGRTFTRCGGPNSGCGCAFQYTGGKITQVKSYCVDFNVCCSSLAACPDGQSDCPAGTICSATTCCPTPVCMPACGASVAPLSGGCTTPLGCMNNVCTGGACGSISSGCDGNSSCFCYDAPDGTGGCGPSIPCDGAQACSSCSDCPAGYFCATNTCCDAAGICIPNCSGGGAPTKYPAGTRMSAGN